jgi:CRP-like cAMP-binding protein
MNPVELKTASDVQDVEAKVSQAEPAETEAKPVLQRYTEETYESEDVRKLIRDRESVPRHYTSLKGRLYKTQNILPEWIQHKPEWEATKGKTDSSNIGETFRLPAEDRTVEQSANATQFIMEMWQTARMMGLKKCSQMLNVFRYLVYQPGEYIITEGEVGHTFYIIIQGSTYVHKDGVGIVAHLGRGKSFGELALAKGDMRSASIVAETEAEVLCLHKTDYDHFIKDIQTAERRENFYLLRDCALFSSWPRAKIEKINNTCQRKTFDIGHEIFKQYDEPDNVYVVMDGIVEIIKEVTIDAKNIWPTSMSTWEESNRTKVKYIPLTTLSKGAHFGEVSILYNQQRSTSAVSKTKCALLVIDKLEFLHMINNDSLLSVANKKGSNAVPTAGNVHKWPKDIEILKGIGHVRGGPGSFLLAGETQIFPNRSRDAIKKEQMHHKFIVTRRKELARQLEKEREREKRKNLFMKKKSVMMGTATEEENLELQAELEHQEKEKRMKEANDMLKLKHENFKEQYQDRLDQSLRSELLSNRLFEHVTKLTFTAEKQAEVEVENAHKTILEASEHRKIILDPLQRLRTGKHPQGNFQLNSLSPNKKTLNRVKSESSLKNNSWK